MPFQPINFANIEPVGNPAMRNLADTLMNSYMKALQLKQIPIEQERAQKEFDLAQQIKQAQLGKMERDEALAQQQADPLYRYNKVNEALQGSNLPPEQKKHLLNMALGYKSGLTPEEENVLDIQKQQTAKALTPEQAALMKAQTDYYRSGGSRQNREAVGTKYQNSFISGIQRDNNVGPDEAIELAGLVRDGYKTKPDGTPIKMSGMTKSSLNQLIRSETPSGLIEKDILAQKAESEMPVINKYIKQGNAVYPVDFFGLSLAKGNDLKDAAKGDDKAVDRLAKYYSSQILVYEQSQLQQLLASGKTTVQATKEIQKDLSRKLKDLGIGVGAVKSKTLDYVNQANKEAFAERRKVGSEASSIIYPKSREEAQPEKVTPPKGAKIRSWDEF